ncbi:sterol 3-beta-glucosyltransferase [Thraustotheca clavata]|uniref:Sterol 3-beta-glucosyltransferase n=1 Tax=Thraustotheca clavata TaxID=74557 RepID=A0A1V9ZPE4_9STRA|nr:sterol 3-beta-glucosyltransferase [Thraustotheca clavata]
MSKWKETVARAKEKIREIDIPIKKTVDSIDIPVNKTMESLSLKIRNLTHRHNDNTDEESHPSIYPTATAIANCDGRIEIEFNDEEEFDLPPQPSLSRSQTQYWNPPFSRSNAVVVNSPTESSTSIFDVPPMHICIMIVGTRGDVQPFIGIGKRLLEDGHRVRLATHAVYRSMVVDAGLEFYPLGGDPKELAAYMVKTGGHIIPLEFEVITKDVPRNIQMIEEILYSTWPAVHSPDPGAESCLSPFRANAIISNPVTYGHIHVAEKLGVPLHIMFPQPWVPTQAFPHPLSNLAYTGKIEKRNYYSYKLVDLLMWQGVEMMTNRFREDVLGLQKIRMGDSGRNILLDLRIPHSFMWSKYLVPSPDDWDPDLYDVIGTVCDNSTSKYEPSSDFTDFLDNGPPPIFVGFGSMVIPNPAKTTKIILDAAIAANVRLVIQSSWSDMTDGGAITIPDNVFILGNCPHDWLFPHMAAVVHHGGAGTTAAGLLAGKPTFIVPFFGDQPFWGWAVESSGVGVRPCPIQDLTVAILTEAFKGLINPKVKEKAMQMKSMMEVEDGVENAVQSFYHHLPVPKMLCAFTPQHIATKWLVHDQAQVCECCAFVIRTATNQPILDYHVMDYMRGPSSGFEGAANGAGAFVHEIGSSLVGVVTEPTKGYKKDGAKGAAIGAAKGIGTLFVAPFSGIALFANRVAVGTYNFHHKNSDKKRKQPRLDTRNLFTKEDVTFSTASDKDDLTYKKLHPQSLAPLVPISLTSSEQKRILFVLKNEIAFKQQRKQLEDDYRRSSITASIVTVESESKYAPQFDEISASVPIVVEGLRWTAAGQFHMDFKPNGDNVEMYSPAALLNDDSLSYEESSSDNVPQFAMNVSVLAIGKRGEVEAFISVAKVLVSDGHHVRFCANAKYESIAVEHGLEFFPLQGNPTSVQDCMAKLFQNISAVDGPWNDILAFLQSTWEAVNSAGYRADLIVSHPAIVVHRYLAERLGIPLHLMSSFPWSPTSEFPNPLMENSSEWNEWGNWLSYAAIDEHVWNHLKDTLNRFRVETLGLPPWHLRLPPSWSVWKIPITYLWSQSLLPKPHDWGQEVEIVGFPELLPTEAAYTPPPTLANFLTASGLSTIYVNINSLELTAAMSILHEVLMIKESFQVVLHNESVRDIFVSDAGRLCVVPSSIPVEWLVEQCDGILHQGSDDVVLALLKCPKPSMACPVTATERLWASKLQEAATRDDGVQLQLPPIPLKDIHNDSQAVAAVFTSLLNMEVKRRTSIPLRHTLTRTSPIVPIYDETKQAARRAVNSIYRNLPIQSMVCDIIPTKLARVYIPLYDLKLSHEAAFTGRQIWGDDLEIKVYKPVYYSLSTGPQYVAMNYRKQINSRAHHKILEAFASILSTESSGQTLRLNRQESMPGVAIDVTSFWSNIQEEIQSREMILRKYEAFIKEKKFKNVLKSLS